jgi:hypothetical protein
MSPATTPRTQVDPERARTLAMDTHPAAPSVAHRVFQTISAASNVSFDVDPRTPEALRRAAVNNTTGTVQAAAGHRTRKALAVILDKLVARGVLTSEDVDDILLAAVDYQEPDPRYEGLDGR